VQANDLVSELTFRDCRAAVAYAALVAGTLSRAAGYLFSERRRHSETRGLDLILIFVIVSYLFWAINFGNYRYPVPLEMLTGIVTVGGLIWLLEGSRLRSLVAIAVFAIAATTTVYPDWGRGEHPSAGIRPARYGDKYVDVRVPQLPRNSLVLIATWEPVSY